MGASMGLASLRNRPTRGLWIFSLSVSKALTSPSGDKTEREDQDYQHTPPSRKATIRVESLVFEEQLLLFGWVPPEMGKLLILRQFFIHSVHHLEHHESLVIAHTRPQTKATIPTMT